MVFDANDALRHAVAVGTTVELHAHVSEALARPPAVVDGLSWTIDVDGDVAADTPAFVLRYTARGDEDVDGPVKSTLRLVDRAGNATVAPVPALSFDFTSPAIAWSVVVAGGPSTSDDGGLTRVARSTLLNVVATADEDLHVVAPLPTGGVDVAPSGSASGRVMSWNVVAGDAVVDGIFSPALPTLADDVDHVVEPPTVLPWPAIVVDDAPPSSLSVTVAPQAVTASTTKLEVGIVRGADVDHVVVAVTNAAGGTLPCVVDDASGCTVAIPTDLVDLPLTVAVVAFDVVGNATSSTPLVVPVDRTAPVASVALATGGGRVNGRVRRGDSVIATVTASEPVRGRLLLRHNGVDAATSTVSAATLAPSATFVVPTVGTIDVALDDVHDGIGNPGASSTSSVLVVDGDAPLITGLHASPATIGVDDDVVVDAVVDAGDGDAAAVGLFADGAAVPGCDGAGGIFACVVPTTTVTATSLVLTLVATDLVGNASQATTVVVRDASPPAISSVELQTVSDTEHPAIRRIGPDQPATVTLAVTEPLSAPPVLQLSALSTSTPCDATVDALVWTCTLVGPASLPGGVDELAVDGVVDVEDVVGNRASVTLPLRIVFDVVAAAPLVASTDVAVAHVQASAAVLVAAPAGTWEPGAFVEVFDASGRRLAGHLADSAGALPALTLGDVTTRVSVRQIDAAGNRSEQLRIQHHRKQTVFPASAFDLVAPLQETEIPSDLASLLSPVAYDPDTGDIVGVGFTVVPCDYNRAQTVRLHRRADGAFVVVGTAMLAPDVVAGSPGDGVLGQVGSALFRNDTATAQWSAVAAPCAANEELRLVAAANGTRALVSCRRSPSDVTLFDRVAGAWVELARGDDGNAVWTIDADDQPLGQTRVPNPSPFGTRLLLTGQLVRPAGASSFAAAGAAPPGEWVGEHGGLAGGFAAQFAQSGGAFIYVDDGVAYAAAARSFDTTTRDFYRAGWLPEPSTGCALRLGGSVLFADNSDCGCACDARLLSGIVSSCLTDQDQHAEIPLLITAPLPPVFQAGVVRPLPIAASIDVHGVGVGTGIAADGSTRVGMELELLFSPRTPVAQPVTLSSTTPSPFSFVGPVVDGSGAAVQRFGYEFTLRATPPPTFSGRTAHVQVDDLAIDADFDYGP